MLAETDEFELPAPTDNDERPAHRGEYEPDPLADPEQEKRRINREKDSAMAEILKRYKDHPVVHERISTCYGSLEYGGAKKSKHRDGFQEFGYSRRLRDEELPVIFSQVQTGLSEYMEQGNPDEAKLIDAASAYHAAYLCNIPLVVYMAKRLRFRNMSGSAMSLSDCIQDGNIALGKAIVRYNPNEGAAFNTYATYWIRNGIQRGISDRGRTIRLPLHLHEEWAALQSASVRLSRINGGAPPSLEALSEDSGMSSDKIKELQILGAYCLQPLDEPITNETSSSLEEELEEEYIDCPTDENEADLANGRLDAVASVGRIFSPHTSINPKGRVVLALRYNVSPEYIPDGDETIRLRNLGHVTIKDLLDFAPVSHRGYADGLSLDEVSAFLGLTRERIRQIEMSALKTAKGHVHHPHR